MRYKIYVKDVLSTDSGLCVVTVSYTHLVEHPAVNRRVGGSSPSVPARIKA